MMCDDKRAVILFFSAPNAELEERDTERSKMPVLRVFRAVKKFLLTRRRVVSSECSRIIRSRVTMI